MSTAVANATGRSESRESLIRGILLSADPRRRRRLVVLTLVFVLAVGVVDFFVGVELSLLVFYILPVCLGVAVSRGFGIATAIICVATWLAGDFAAGAHYASYGVAFWNALFALGTYLVVIWMFDRVLSLQRDMEERVRQRTLALRQVIAERERLEKALLEISERERRRIGHDLHDGLGQHLTGTALAGEVLADKLRSRGVPEESDVWKIVELIEEGIEKTRRLARGLLLAEIPRDGLVAALQDLAGDTSRQYGILCEFTGEAAEVRLADNDAATHLFRIAQEAIRNAIHHGRTKRVVIALVRENGLELAVRDFGNGFREPRGQGLGLSIMAHRAEIIGASFAIAAHPAGGTVVTCRLPEANLRHD